MDTLNDARRILAELTFELDARADIERQVGKDADGCWWPAYAWPGGYSIAYITDDGDELCAACMDEQDNPVHFSGMNDGWKVVGFIAYGATSDYPASDAECVHCHSVICEAGG